MPPATILRVNLSRAKPKIGDSVVGPISIDVVDHPKVGQAKVDRPCNAMSKKQFSIYGNAEMPLAMRSGRGIARILGVPPSASMLWSLIGAGKQVWGAVLPNECAGSGVIV